jgi:hypothetical protein
MADNIDDINKQIGDLRKQLGQNPLSLFDQKDLEKAKLALSGLRNELREMNSDLNYIAQSFKDSVAELSKQNAQLTIARNSLKGISNIARDLVDYRKGEVDLSEKQLKNLQRQAKLKFEDLQSTLRSGKLTAAQADEVKDTLSQQETFNTVLNRTIELQDQVNKEIGLMGVGLEGAGKFLEKLGFVGISKPITDAIQATKRARFEYKLNQDAIQDIGKEMAALNRRNLSDLQIRYGFGGKELKNLLAQKDALIEQNKELDKKTSKYRNIAIALKEQFTLVNMTDAIITKVVQSFFKLDEAQTKFKNLTGGTIPLLDQMNGRLISSVDYIQTAASLTEQTGMNAAAIFTPDTLASAAEMVKAMGMTQDQANRAAMMSQVNGQSIDQMNASIKQGTKEHNATNRSALAQGVIMREVYSTSTALAASLGNSTKRITEAATRAKDLGLNLAEVDGIANSLLNVEQSIASEFEYEVISGKQINLEAARYYALTNQTEKLTKEIGKNQAIVNSFASGNRIEQEAAAKVLGVSRDKLAEMYMADQRRLGLTDAQIAKNMDMQEGDIKRLSLQESINTSINKMTELLAGPLEMMAQLIDNAWVLYGIMGAIGTIVSVQLVKGFVDSIKYVGQLIVPALRLLGIYVAQAAAWAIANPFSALAGLVIAGGVGAVVYSQMKDGIIDPQKGPVMTGEFGSVQLDPNDKAMYGADGKIKVGTNLNPNSPQSNQIKTQSAQQSSPIIDYEKLGAHIAQAVSKVQVQTNLDGVAVSRGLQTPMGITTRKI